MVEPGRRARPATYDDLLAVPDHLVAEIVDGELHVSPRPAPRHADASSALGSLLNGPFDRGRAGPGGWRILFEPELHLGSDVLVPDLAGWRRERLPTLPEEAFFSLAPDWICEVLSPSTAGLDRIKKLPSYARHRVAHAWLVEPVARTLEVLQLEGGRWVIMTTCGESGAVSLPPFDALPIDMATVWDLPSGGA